MAQFKTYRGKEEKVSNTEVQKIEDGSLYFATDTHNLYIDDETKRNVVGVGKNTPEGGEIFNDYENNKATGVKAHSEGLETNASGIASHAEGLETKAIGNYSHAEGRNSIAFGENAHAENEGVATADYSHAEGSGRVGIKGFIIYPKKIQETNQFYTEEYSLGWQTEFTSIVQAGKYCTLFDGAKIHDLGEIISVKQNGNIPPYIYDIEFEKTVYFKNNKRCYLIVEDGSFGLHNLGRYGHAEGQNTFAFNDGSHVEGLGTIATVLAQHVQGKYNKVDAEEKYVHIVGNGTGDEENQRSNAHTIDWDGNAWFAGNVTVGNDNDKLVKTSEINNKEDIFNKTNLLSDASTNEQYPSAKATVDYVKQKISGIYTFLGSNALDQLPEANTIGKGAVFNMLDSGKRVFSSNAFGKISSINIEECPKIVFEFPLPDAVLKIEIIDEESMQIYTISNLQYSNFIDGKYVYSDIDGVLYNTNTEHSHYCMTCEYTLSVNKGDNIISTGYYWDNFGSYIDLSMYATKNEINEELNNFAGQKTENNGEIFNDYTNNKAISNYSHAEGNNTFAGGKAYRITNLDRRGGLYTLDDVTGLEEGDIYSVRMNSYYLNCGEITYIDPQYNYVGVNYLHGSEDLQDITNENETTTKNTFFVSAKPQLGTIEIGYTAHAEGLETKAVNGYSHAEGYKTQAIGKYGHAEGNSTIAGHGAHAEGYGTEAIGINAHTEGYLTKAIGGGSHAEGIRTQAIGDESHAEGNDTVAEGKYSHAEGNSTQALGNYTHSEGNNTIASGIYAHAEGTGTKANASAAHAEGQSTQATNTNAHAEGWTSEATGVNAHAEGGATKANANNSHAEGKGTIASAEAQHVEGMYNLTNNNMLHILGNGTDEEHRGNAHTIDKNGNAWFAGGILLTTPDGTKKYKITIDNDGQL